MAEPRSAGDAVGAILTDWRVTSTSTGSSSTWSTDTRSRRGSISALRRGALQPGPDSSRLPERFYTERDREALEIRRGWIGPEGERGPAGIPDNAYLARTSNKLDLEAPFGLLLGAVHVGHGDPPQRTMFAVGARWHTQWSSAPGTLRFAVNDVWDAADDRFPDKFYVDNVGFFLVRVLVTR